MSIVVTGATGALGRHVIEGLLKKVPAEQITAVVRSEEKGADYASRGIKLAIADYSKPETLDGVFAAGDKVLFISGSEIGQRVPQHTAVVEAAKKAGVALLAYTSVLGAPEADFRLAAEHQVTEKLILESGLPHVFLRNGWYNENYTEQLAPVLQHNAVVQAAGDGRVASAARADYAAAAVVVLTEEGHENKAYELSGDTAWSYAEYAAELSKQTGKEIVYQNVPAEAYQGILTGAAGLPEPLAATLVDVDKAVERGRLAGTSGQLSKLIGRPTTPIAESIAAALKG
ncbi:SDR family oxidoreductase [Streptomyces sp. NBC_00457]|uniref:SDR family oxidoreductase n=1 Tax=Streptomyces sp. NBC_00457 TaxID=2975748 RepID=UPI002E1EA777